MKPFQARLLVLTAVWAQSAIAGAVEPSAIVFDRNVPQDLRNQVLNDITFVGSLEGSGESVLHNEIFGRVGGTTYKRFFEAHVKKAGVQDCGSPNAVACV